MVVKHQHPDQEIKPGLAAPVVPPLHECTAAIRAIFSMQILFELITSTNCRERREGWRSCNLVRYLLYHSTTVCTVPGTKGQGHFRMRKKRSAKYDWKDEVFGDS